MSEPNPTEHPELAASAGGTMLTLHVQPAAKRPGFHGRHGDAVRMRVTAPPSDGRANHEVIALLASVFGLPRSAVQLVAGASSRRKRVLLAGVALADAAAVIDQVLGPSAP